jgi:hypothetical protein
MSSARLFHRWPALSPVTDLIGISGFIIITEDITMPATAARLFCLAMLLSFSLPAFAGDDTPQNREQQAERYLQAVSPQAMMGEMTNKLAQTLPPEQQPEFKALMAKHLDMDRVTAAIKTAMVKTFTTEELQALADFYGSSVGKSAMAKMGDYMAEVMPTTMNEIQSALAKAQEETAKKK